MADFRITLQYNTEREQLIVPEFGRHLQKIIQKIATIEDKKLRGEKAKQIIKAMAKMHTKGKDAPDFQHKLWDMLFIMSNFELDIESPYPRPTLESVTQKPGKLNYPQQEPHYRYYGNNVMRMIQTCKQYPEGNAKNSFKLAIADHMKRCFVNWNKETVQDDIIFEHLKELSQGDIDLTQSNKDLSHHQRKQRNKNNFRKNNFNANKKNFGTIGNNSFSKKRNIK